MGFLFLLSICSPLSSLPHFLFPTIPFLPTPCRVASGASDRPASAVGESARHRTTHHTRPLTPTSHHIHRRTTLSWHTDASTLSSLSAHTRTKTPYNTRDKNTRQLPTSHTLTSTPHNP
ncbi:hypothetical protein Pcinc_026690 [Petrolisthes cinctipes]|uniref:Secreted protein n=1 Tax=Petrolisthes cinctipes TaxID=88211 RepID=A0AAE1KBX8_PETCI|nr:hypothetical protein Pcinc_026690 [Petrolisthes cinctipes]